MKIFFITLLLSLSALAADGKKFELKVNGHAVIHSRDIVEAKASESGSSEWVVELKFSHSATRKFAKITKKNIGKQMDIVVDGKVRNSPTIKDEITSGSVVVGGFTQQEATELAGELTHKKK